MEAFATWFGTFCGAALKACGPEISAIIAAAIKEAFRNEAEQSRPPADLRPRLEADIARLRERLAPK